LILLFSKSRKNFALLSLTQKQQQKAHKEKADRPHQNLLFFPCAFCQID